MTNIFAVRSQSPRSYGCPGNCGQTFVGLNTFYKHWRQHVKQCPISNCKTRSSSKFNFKRHWEREHGNYFPDHPSVERTACRHNCGKLYSKADVSNMRRHERTCRGNRAGRQCPDPEIRVGFVHGAATLAADQSSHYVNTPETLSDLVESSRDGILPDSMSSDRLASERTHNLHGTTDSARDYECWRDCRPVVEAIETIQGVLAGGPAADALQAFTTFLDNLGPSLHIPRLSVSNGSNDAPELSDKSVDSESVQQGGSRRSMDTENEISSHIYSEKYGLEADYDQEFTLENPYRILVVASKIVERFLYCKSPSSNLYEDLYHSSVQVLEEVSDFCEWFATILASIDIWLHPNVITLGLLLVYQLKRTPFFRCKPGDERHVVGVALMLAERFVKDEPHTAASWAEATGIPEARMIIMKRRFLEETYVLMETIFDGDRDWSKFLDELHHSFEIHDEFREPSQHSLLQRIRGWHRLSPDIGSGWYLWN